MTARADAIAAKIEAFIRTEVIPYEKDPRTGPHGPSDDLVQELRDKARKAGVLTPHILPDGSHFKQRETAIALIKSGLSPLGPLACNTMAPDEGNMYLLGKVGSAEQKKRFLEPLVSGRARSAFFMTEPADEGGAGSDPSMMQTTCKLDGNHWVINGRKKFITGAEGARVGIVMAKSDDGACLFLVDLPDPAIKTLRVLDTIDSSMPGGHAEIEIENLRVSADQMLGASGMVSNTRKSVSARRVCRTACAGWASPSAPMRSPPTTPAAATRSENRWSITKASVSCWRRT
jgi:acyl-CoA dehydrogenase